MRLKKDIVLTGLTSDETRAVLSIKEMVQSGRNNPAILGVLDGFLAGLYASNEESLQSLCGSFSILLMRELTNLPKAYKDGSQSLVFMYLNKEITELFLPSMSALLEASSLNRPPLMVQCLQNIFRDILVMSSCDLILESVCSSYNGFTGALTLIIDKVTKEG